jgi:hypothetical protein
VWNALDVFLAAVLALMVAAAVLGLLIGVSPEEDSV